MASEAWADVPGGRSDVTDRRKVLVTGGAGFVGANLVRLLLAREYAVTVVDDFSVGQRPYVQGIPVDIVRGDVLDRALLSQVMPSHWGVVHLAAQSGVPTSIEDPDRDCRLNVLGTQRVLEAARHAGVARFVMASSNAVLGRQHPPAIETQAPLPISPYGASKLAGEAYCLAYHGSWGMGTVALRFGNVYGPYSMHKQSVVATFFRDLRQSGRIAVHGDGHQTRDFIYVQDLCEAIVLGLESRIGGEVFQAASGTEVSIDALARLVVDVADVDAHVAREAARRGDVPRSYSRIAKIKRELGWTPTTSLRRGLEQTYAWFRHATSVSA